MTLQQLKLEARKEFDEKISSNIKTVSIGQYNASGVNIGFISAEDLTRNFIDSLITKAYEAGINKVKKEVKEYLLAAHMHFDKEDPWDFVDERPYVDSLELEDSLDII